MLFQIFSIAYPPCCVVDAIVCFAFFVLFSDNEVMLASGTCGSPHLSETAAQGMVMVMVIAFAIWKMPLSKATYK